MTVPILIPAYKPDKLLLDLINQLIELEIKDIIIVDDGSGSESKEVFDQIREKGICKICTHVINLGKGRAIKTGLNFALSYYPELKGIVTADADGQHSPNDIVKVQKKVLESHDTLIIGCRSFGEKVPLRSKLGNIITKKVFHILTNIRLSDTQSGLRGIPISYMAECLKLDGEKYEYEINMLVSCNKHGISITEIPIKTIYIEQNRSSHFNPIFDSIKIYFVLFRFLLSSLSTSLIDFIVFIISTGAGFNVLTSTMIARIIAGNYNFMINKKIVFKSSSNAIWSFVKYWLLVVVLGSLSYLSITALVDYMNLNLIFSKALSETLLFFISFAVQSKLIFNSTENSNGKN